MPAKFSLDQLCKKYGKDVGYDKSKKRMILCQCKDEKGETCKWEGHKPRFPFHVDPILIKIFKLQKKRKDYSD